MNATKNLLTNLCNLLVCTCEAFRYGLTFLQAILCSRAVLAAKLLAVESQPATGPLSLIAALSKHIQRSGSKVFTGDAFAELLKQWNIKPRFGAVGKHGSIAVTERVIKTLKHEWLKRVAIIKGFDHLTLLCGEFESWYNSWRPHMMLEGLRPDDLYDDRKPEKPKRDSKTVPCNIERHVFQETRLTAYRLKDAA